MTICNGKLIISVYYLKGETLSVAQRKQQVQDTKGMPSGSPHISAFCLRCSYFLLPSLDGPPSPDGNLSCWLGSASFDTSMVTLFKAPQTLHRWDQGEEEGRASWQIADCSTGRKYSQDLYSVHLRVSVSEIAKGRGSQDSTCRRSIRAIGGES